MNQADLQEKPSDLETPVVQQIEQLVLQYYPYLVRLVQSIVHDAGEAEDIVQETFISAIKGIDQDVERINYKGWLSKIAVNKARDLLRRRQVRQRWSSLFGRSAQTTQRRMPEEIASSQEVVQQLWLAVEQLNEKHRIPIILRYGQGLPIREIARLLDVKEGTVHSRLHNGQKQLARMLDLDREVLLILQGVAFD